MDYIDPHMTYTELRNFSSCYNSLNPVIISLKFQALKHSERPHRCLTTQFESPIISTMSLLSGEWTIICPFLRYGILRSYSFGTLRDVIAASLLRLRINFVFTCLKTVSSISWGSWVIKKRPSPSFRPCRAASAKREIIRRECSPFAFER